MLLNHFKIFLLLGAGLARGSVLTYPYKPHQRHERTLYFLDNDPAGNELISLQIDAVDGTLSSPVRTSTGGNGLAGLVAISQDSVVVSENVQHYSFQNYTWRSADDSLPQYIFSINAGSNTLSMFSINPQDPQHPHLLGTPQPTLGQTPVSVAYSPKLKTACVANGGSPAGVTCFSTSPTHGLTPLGPLRLLPQTQLADPSPPPPGPLVLTADITFNPSSTALFLTFRSNGLLPGSIYAFRVCLNGTLDLPPTRSQFPALAGTFSLNFLASGPNPRRLSDDRLLVTNAFKNATGAALLRVEYPSLKIRVEREVPLRGQQGTCWVGYDPRVSSRAYVMDAGQAVIDVVDAGTGRLERRVRIGGEWIYVLTDDPNHPNINVFKIQGGPDLNPVQQFDLFGSAVGSIPEWMGLAIWPNTLQ
ncbi:MAG: hypothetical protein Q9195_005641 [Heterodermia aff. obscurata]